MKFNEKQIKKSCSPEARKLIVLCHRRRLNFNFNFQTHRFYIVWSTLTRYVNRIYRSSERGKNYVLSRSVFEQILTCG